MQGLMLPNIPLSRKFKVAAAAILDLDFCHNLITNCLKFGVQIDNDHHSVTVTENATLEKSQMVVAAISDLDF